ncbi:hypothetical protein [Halostella salina]|uniref:hypothetical protein n=1 Tax=Halostella salina TaxID=1547897 RepID=UPI0013CF0A1A|nr:hypothetical protein [Halostella salina]
MPDTHSSITFESTGENALNSALDALEMINSKGQDFERVYIELESKPRVEDDPSIDSRQTTQSEFMRNSENEQVEGQIRQGTSHHKILRALYNDIPHPPASTKKILEKTDLGEGTGYAAMSDLHDRGLVIRSEGEGQSYEYEISEAGKNELRRLSGD